MCYLPINSIINSFEGLWFLFGGYLVHLMDVKGIQHKGSICPVIIEGTPEALQFAWLVGVGELTGSGKGSASTNTSG